MRFESVDGLRKTNGSGGTPVRAVEESAVGAPGMEAAVGRSTRL